MHGAIDRSARAGERLLPGEAAGARPSGVRGRAAHLRHRVAARLRGEQDISALVGQGLRLGRDVYIAGGAYLDPGFPWLISIGDETTLGPSVTILAHDATPKLRTGYTMVAPVRIGARVFVGANATILAGVAIGDDAIVGAGSVIRRDVPPGRVVFGNPAADVGSVEEQTQRHRANIQTRPCYPSWAALVDASRGRMLGELQDGPGYVR